MDIRDILLDNRKLFAIAFVLGFALGGFPAYNSEMVIISLILMMSISLQGLELSGEELRGNSKDAGLAMMGCYLISGAATLAPVFLFEGSIAWGWAILAAVPPAISIIPATLVMGGNVRSSLVSTTVVYLGAIAIAPTLTLLFIEEAVDPTTVLFYVLLFVLVPLIISRPLKRVSMDERTKLPIINIMFFILIFAGIGPNREMFLADPLLVAGMVIICVVRIFGVGLGLEALGRRRRMERSSRVSLVLYSTWKNSGMAMAMAFALLGGAAALPAAISIVVEIGWYMFLTGGIYRASGIASVQ